MSTIGHTHSEDIWAIHPTLSLDIPCKTPLSTAESLYHTSPPCSSPPSPFTESSPSSSDTEDTEESDDAQVIIKVLFVIAYLSETLALV